MKHVEIIAGAKMLSCAARHATWMSAGNWKPDWAPSIAVMTRWMGTSSGKVIGIIL
jgi:hypothetical protein